MESYPKESAQKENANAIRLTSPYPDFNINQAVTTMPEFMEALTEAVRQAVESPHVAARRRALTVIRDQGQMVPALRSDLLCRLLADADPQIRTDALMLVGENSNIPWTKTISEQVRKLAAPDAPNVTRSTAILTIGELPDRTEADREMIARLKDDGEERVRLAVKGVLRRWELPKKK
jgi:HEAT repeat protein